MKQLVGVDIGSYTFNKTNKTVTFTNCGNLILDNILLITNVTNHIIIYNFADVATTGTITNNILTLAYNTSSMSNTDNLQIYIDIPRTSIGDLNDTNILLRRLVKNLESISVVDSKQRQRIAVEDLSTALTSMTGLSSGAGVATTNSPTASSPVSSTGSTYWLPVWVGPVDQRWLIIDQARATYANGIRSKLV